MNKINKIMNLAIYHPSERVRKKNEARFFRELLSVKDDYELGKMVDEFFIKGYEYNLHKNFTNFIEYHSGLNTYIYKQRKSYLHMPDKKRRKITHAAFDYIYNHKMAKYRCNAPILQSKKENQNEKYW